MASKKTLIFIILILLISIAAAPVLSVGMRGDYRFFKVFKANDHLELKYSVISNMAPMEVSVYMREPEELQGTSKVDVDSIFLKHGASKGITVTIDLPEDVKTPGEHVYFVVAEESPPKIRGGQIGAKGRVMMAIKIFKPYPGKYLLGEIDAKATKEEEEMAIDLILRNMGNESISEAKAIIEIYDEHGKKTDTVQAYQPGNKNDFSISIGAEQTSKMYADWTPAVGVKGKFRLKALIDYDGIDLEINGTGYVGYKNMTIIDYSRQLEVGRVVEYFVEVESLWNEYLYDVYTEITFLNKTGGEIDTVRSPKYDVWSFETQRLKNYWNTMALKPGNYTAHIKLSFDKEHMTEKKVNIELIEPIDPVTENPLFTGKLVLVVVLVFVILLIIGGNLFFFIFMKKRSKEEEEKPTKVSGKSKKGKKESKKQKPTKDELERKAEEELAELENLDLD